MFNGYWTRERVLNGLKRYARDYFEGREAELPPRMHNYRNALSDAEWRFARKMRLYPDYQVVFRYFRDFPEAWAEIGYTVEMTPLAYWTREEVINGLKRFHADFKLCPTSSEKYMEKQQFCERFGKNGKPKKDGAYCKYPSIHSVLNYFDSMRQAWQAAGFDVDNGFEPWSPLEDWFILESVGILPRTEVAELMKRTVPAIKRRLYDLGRTNSKNRWGISLLKAGTLLGLGGHVIQKYLEYGFIPYFRGNKVIYINPADLLEVKEFDWTAPINPELENLVRRALAQRVCKIIKYGSEWRSHEVYTFQKTKEYYKARIKNPRKSAFSEKLPAPPNNLAIGDWITLKQRIRQVSEDRKGVIKGIFYSPQKQPRTDGTKRCAWMANIEFPKIKRFTPDGENRVRYNIPLDALERTEPPQIEPKPLSQHPEAIRGRKRFGKALSRARDRFSEIRETLT